MIDEIPATIEKVVFVCLIFAACASNAAAQAPASLSIFDQTSAGKLTPNDGCEDYSPRRRRLDDFDLSFIAHYENRRGDGAGLPSYRHLGKTPWQVVDRS